MSNLKKRKFNRETETIDEKNKREKYETTDNIYLNEENFILEKVTNKRVTNDNIMVYTKNNFYYKGSVVNGLFSGQGSLTNPYGDKYIGKFKDGKFNGQGTLTFVNHVKCVKYEGEFKDDKPVKGIMIYKDGSNYNGDWEDCKLNGEGTFTYPNGDKYIGQFKDGKRNGQGTLTFVNDVKYVKYEGEFKDDQLVKGIIIYKDGSNYNGDFFEGKKHGYGIETFPLNGGFYKGNFKEDKKDGEGTLELPNGYKYTGSWRNGKREGKGEEFIPRSGYMIDVTRKGNWNNDKPQGDFDVSGKTFFPQFLI